MCLKFSKWRGGVEGWASQRFNGCLEGAAGPFCPGPPESLEMPLAWIFEQVLGHEGQLGATEDEHSARRIPDAC